MTNDTDLDQDVEERFTLRSRPEIVSVLRGLQRRHAMITIYFDQGREFILTSILAINPDFQELVLDLGPDARANNLLLKTTHLEVVSFEGRVKVQFGANRAEATVYEGRPAFRVRMPSSLVRLQRREFYRAEVPNERPIKAYLQLRSDRPDELLEARLLDISCGGIALMSTENGEPLKSGRVYPACSINLPGIGTVSAPVELCNTGDISWTNGKPHQRLGCRFVDPSGRMQTMIQRYINNVERANRGVKR